MKHLLAIVFLIPLSLSAEISKLEYHGFTLWFDCKAKVAIRFQYTLDRDVGAIRRIHKYYHDPILAPYCQQFETLSYNKNKNIEGYDRGHLVPYNHMDQSLIASHQTNYMTNILPQTKEMNRGAWYLTEEIAECFRDYSRLNITGGAIWKGETTYLPLHGILIPDSFWKVIIRNDEVIAWLIPNSTDATKGRLDEYLVSVHEIEEITDVVIPIDQAQKKTKPTQSWDTDYCNERSEKHWRGGWKS